MKNLLLGSVNGQRNSPQTNPKSENQSHALVFARGEVIEVIGKNTTAYCTS